MPLTILHDQDITELKTDAIVNAANTQLLEGGGVCGAIFAAAGRTQLAEACRKLAPAATGHAVMTPGFRLPAKYIIHTPGPVYDPAHPQTSRQLLENSYTNSLKLAQEHGLASVAFPLISSGIYGYPRQQALEAAVQAIETFLTDHDMQVYLTLF